MVKSASRSRSSADRALASGAKSGGSSPPESTKKPATEAGFL